MDDRSVVAAQIEREPRSVVDVVVRCPLELPVVIKVPPHLDDGTPFPTTYWLTCPLATRRIGRLEADGGVKKAESRIEQDPAFAAEFRSAMERYERERDAMIPGGSTDPRPSGGVGGSRRGVKCLHAHYADHVAGNKNPVGADTARRVGPLDCTTACVASQAGDVARNPDWIEP